jgi:O-antigen ligase
MASACAGNRAALIAYVSLLTFMTDSMLHHRAVGETGADWQSLMKCVIWLGAGVIGYFQIPTLRRLTTSPAAVSMLAFVVVSLLSGLYSPTPVYSFGCALSLFSLYVFSGALVSKLSETEFLWAIVLTLTAFLMIGWVVYYESPPFATAEEWSPGGVILRMSGITGQANNLGAVCDIQLGAVFLLWYARRCRLAAAIPFAAVGLISLMASDSRTGMIELGLASMAVLLRPWPLVLGSALLATGLALLTAMAGSFHMEGLLGHFSRTGDPSDVTTLTGRFEIWSFVQQKILDSPIIGWGYNSSKVLITVDLGTASPIDTAHNMLLQSLLSVGLIGTLPVVAFIVYLGIAFVRRPAPFRDFFFIASLVCGVTESYPLGATPTLHTLLLFMTALWPGGVKRSTG